MIAGEPVLADDAARSLATGERQPPLPPATMADGLLTGLSDRTFAIIREHVARDRHRHRGRDPRGDADRVAVHEAGHRTVGRGRRRGRAQRPLDGRGSGSSVRWQRRSRSDVRTLCARTVAATSGRGTRGCASRRTRPCPLADPRSRTSCFERGDLLARPLVQPLLLGDEVQRALVALHRERRRRRDLAGELAARRRARRRSTCCTSPSRERLLGVDVRPASRKSRAAPWPTSMREPPDVARG